MPRTVACTEVDTARRVGVCARAQPLGLLFALLLTTVAAGQATTGDPVDRLLWSDAARYLDDEQPEVRGEAALLLASSHDPHHYEAILRIARDEAPAAQLRGILALGWLGDPAARTALMLWLEESAARARPRGVAAAFALGLLPDDGVDAAVARELVRFRETNMKRQRDVVLALLVALSARGTSAQVEALRQLHADDSIRDPVVRTAILQAMLRSSGAFSLDELRTLLASSVPADRRLAATELGSGSRAPDAALRRDLVRVGKSDADAATRQAALRALTVARDPAAPELAVRALRSPEPLDVEQGARTMLLLGGTAERAAVERQFEHHDAECQQALLRGFTGAMSSEFAANLLRLCEQPDARMPLRAVAALALAANDPDGMSRHLHALFATATDARLLRELAGAMLVPGREPPPLAALQPSAPTADLAADTDRLVALLHAGHAEASRFCLEQLQQKDLPAAARASVLFALRCSHLPPLPAELAMLLPATLQPLVH